MIKILVPLAIAVIAVVLVLALRSGKGLIRGIADNMLVSPARPALAVRPAPDFRLVDARRLETSPSVQGSSLPSTSVQVLYSLHQRPETSGQQPARLLSLIALVEMDGLRWPVQPETPPKTGNLLRREAIRLYELDGTAETYQLADAADPWQSGLQDVWQQGSLVRRFTFLLHLQQAKLMVEYREPLPPSPLPLADNLPLLAAFEQRAEASFSLLKEQLPKPEQRLSYPPDSVNRKALTSWVGPLWSPDPR